MGKAIYQNKHSYFLGITPTVLVFTAGTASGYQQGFQIQLVLITPSKECHKEVKGMVKSLAAFHYMPVFTFLTYSRMSQISIYSCSNNLHMFTTFTMNLQMHGQLQTQAHTHLYLPKAVHLQRCIEVDRLSEEGLG